MPTGIDMPGMQRVRRKSRAVLRKSGLAPSGPVYGRLVDAGRSLPIPAAARVAVSTAVLRRPWKVPVRFDQLLVGAQGGWTAREFAERTGDLLWPSTPFLDGPHVALLRLADERPDLTDEEILASGYGRPAALHRGGRRLLRRHRRGGVLAAARAFIARYRGEEVPGAQPRPQQSGPQDPVLVAPVRGSDQYQILDGHHRLAIAAMSGADGGNVVAKWLPVTTPLQDLLLKMSWLDGTHELYQPVDAPELRSGWTTVRQCTDRLAKMDAFLAERGIAGGRYLDVASCYGWFVAEMAERGFDAEGIERDPLAVPLGQAVYGLPDGVVSTGDCVEFLDGHDAAAGTWCPASACCTTSSSAAAPSAPRS